MTAIEKPDLSATVAKIRGIQPGKLLARSIATSWLSLWTAVGYTLGSVVFVVHLAVWSVGFVLGWSFHAANYGFRQGAHIKTEPKRKPSMPV
jgi:hypothetical protein